MINIVIPMAGLGSRFVQAGYAQPKPMIPVLGRPMIELAVANLRPSMAHRFIFICQRAHEEQHGISRLLREIAPGCELILIDGVTEGAACSVLLAEAFIDNAQPLVIANCDQYVDIDIDTFFERALAPEVDGLIMTMPGDHPKWSYVRRGASGWVEEVREKVVISNEATVGIYHFRKGSDFVQAAHAMIARDERVNNEFYVAPVYNGLIGQGRRIGGHDIGDAMFGIGTPEDLQAFLTRFDAGLWARFDGLKTA
jgi:NDP-sugar pyrophosphorylase family protein